jgi:hypothetical protein
MLFKKWINVLICCFDHNSNYILSDIAILDGYPFLCRSYFTGTQVTTALYSVSGAISVSTALASLPSPGWFNAMSVQVRFQASDFAHSSTAMPAASNSSLHHGLSTGTKAGIGVALGVILMIMGLGAWIAWRKRRPAQKRINAMDDVVDSGIPGVADAKAQHLYPGYKAELEGESHIGCGELGLTNLARQFLYTRFQYDGTQEHNGC